MDRQVARCGEFDVLFHSFCEIQYMYVCFSLRPLRSADAGVMSVMTVDRTMLGTDMKRLWESNC